jgi:hypothetical protein
MPLEQAVLTPAMRNIAISRKAAKDILCLHHAKTEMTYTDFKYKKQIYFSLKNADRQWPISYKRHLWN